MIPIPSYIGVDPRDQEIADLKARLVGMRKRADALDRELDIARDLEAKAKRRAVTLQVELDHATRFIAGLTSGGDYEARRALVKRFEKVLQP